MASAIVSGMTGICAVCIYKHMSSHPTPYPEQHHPVDPVISAGVETETEKALNEVGFTARRTIAIKINVSERENK